MRVRTPVKSASFIVALIRFVSVASALALVFLATVPLVAAVGICLVCCFLFVPELVAARHRGQAGRFAGMAVCGITFLLPINLIVASATLSFWDNYYAGIAWLIATATGITTVRLGGEAPKTPWKIATVVWLLLGEYALLVGAYLQNRTPDFYVGVVTLVALLVLVKIWFRSPYFVVLGLNTAILLVIFLPVADLFLRPGNQPDVFQDVAGRDYRYEESQKDSRAYARYARKYANQYQHLVRELYLADPEQRLPYLIRSNQSLSFFQSHIQINSDGFRGPELVHPKGETYRIVALGESTTFGFTLTPEHQPWPEYLAEMIHSRLQPRRPVEVINAGVPGYSLAHNLVRLKKTILAMKPDMIISYHGYNGFNGLSALLPPVLIKRLPAYWPRPLWLLAECEYRVRVDAFRRRLTVADHVPMPPMAELLQSPYARCYEELISLAATNGIRLVVGNYSMAVNPASEPAVKEFYRNTGFPNLYPSLQVNELHSALVAEIGRRHPEVLVVDTHPRLDGWHEKFTDLVHFDAAGDRLLAEHFFGSVSNLLWQELVRERIAPASP